MGIRGHPAAAYLPPGDTDRHNHHGLPNVRAIQGLNTASSVLAITYTPDYFSIMQNYAPEPYDTQFI